MGTTRIVKIALVALLIVTPTQQAASDASDRARIRRLEQHIVKMAEALEGTIETLEMVIADDTRIADRVEKLEKVVSQIRNDKRQLL